MFKKKCESASSGPYQRYQFLQGSVSDYRDKKWSISINNTANSAYLLLNFGYVQPYQ
jgi:hypothetical protein